MYTGWAAGSHFQNSGGGSNYQCVTEEPQNFAFGPGTVDSSYIYGTEYKIWSNTPRSNHHLHDDDVPCAVCYVSTRVAHLMIPGRYTCPQNWTREYYGYTSWLNATAITDLHLSVWMPHLKLSLVDMLTKVELGSIMLSLAVVVLAALLMSNRKR